MSQEENFTLNQPLIELSEAKNYIESWTNYQSDLTRRLGTLPESGPLSIKAFTIHLDDMIDLLNRVLTHNDPHFVKIPKIEPALDTHPISALRFYLGMKPNPNPNINKNDAEKIPCLVFNPVIDFKKGEGDIPPQGGLDTVSLEDVTACYDFTFPCPDTCGNLMSELRISTMHKA
jgi:hypothetical protein